MTDEAIERKIANLSPYYRDFCEVWDSNKKASRKVMPGTCLACVYGDRYEHAHDCEHDPDGLFDSGVNGPYHGMIASPDTRPWTPGAEYSR